MTQQKRHLGAITVLIKDRHTHAKSVNEILTKHGKIILARLGVNTERTCTENYGGLITVAVEGTAEEVNALYKELDELYGIVARKAIVTE